MQNGHNLIYIYIHSYFYKHYILQENGCTGQSSVSFILASYVLIVSNSEMIINNDCHDIISSQKHTFQKIPNSAIRISYFIEAIAQLAYFCLVNMPKLLITSYRLTRSRISPGGKARIRKALESNTNLQRLW